MDNTGITQTYIWIAIYGVCVITFFGIAVWVIIRGASDLRDLLSKTEKNGA